MTEFGPKTSPILMNKIRKFYEEYKPYIFSDGWYYVFIIVFILLLFIFFS